MAAAALVTIVLAACSAVPVPTDPDNAAPSRHGSPAPSPLGLDTTGWFEVVDTTFAMGGDSQRWLDFGTADGRYSGRIRLGELPGTIRERGVEPFTWAGPQADGIFDGRMIVWGRENDGKRIETLDLQDGALTGLGHAPDTVHVATATLDLRRIFYITVDAATDLPSGLFLDDLHDGAPRQRINYAFSDGPVSNRFKYRLAASADGTLLAVQPDEEAVSIIHLPSGETLTVEPGAPMVGFAGRDLISLGPGSSVIAFDSASGNGRTLAEGVAGAQVVAGGRWVAVMHLDADLPRWYAIDAIEVATGATGTIYRHDTDDVGPVLPRKDRQIVGVDVPDGWIVLADTFFPFIVDEEGRTAKPLEESRFPRLINVETGEVHVMGPFVADGG